MITFESYLANNNNTDNNNTAITKYLTSSIPILNDYTHLIWIKVTKVVSCCIACNLTTKLMPTFWVAQEKSLQIHERERWVFSSIFHELGKISPYIRRSMGTSFPSLGIIMWVAWLSNFLFKDYSMQEKRKSLLKFSIVTQKEIVWIHGSCS